MILKGGLMGYKVGESRHPTRGRMLLDVCQAAMWSTSRNAYETLYSQTKLET
jgi:hypothetical protein